MRELATTPFEYEIEATGEKVTVWTTPSFSDEIPSFVVLGVGPATLRIPEEDFKTILKGLHDRYFLRGSASRVTVDCPRY